MLDILLSWLLSPWLEDDEITPQHHPVIGGGGSS